jgi:hypothetical protein
MSSEFGQAVATCETSVQAYQQLKQSTAQRSGGIVEEGSW